MLQKLPIINQQNFHGCMDSGTALKEFFLFFSLLSGNAALTVAKWKEIWYPWISHLVFCFLHMRFSLMPCYFFIFLKDCYQSQLKAKWCLSHSKKPGENCFRGLLVMNSTSFFFSSGRGSHRRVCLQGVPFKLLYRWLSQLDAACIAIVLNSTFKEQFNILTEVLAKLSQFWHCNGRSVLWNWWKEIF